MRKYGDGVPRYFFDELECMELLEKSHEANLYYRDNNFELWLSRCTKADGEPFERTVTVRERDANGIWQELYRYDGANPRVVLYPDGTYNLP